MPHKILLGDEAVALGAIHAGLTAAYAYPGTPSTEIMEYILKHKEAHGAPHAAWCVNEKTAYEAALGVAFAGRRAMVSMKHVGLNVAADPFMNSALVATHGGLVVTVADDPGMHSSQNEQDSRYYADFAKVLCLEPSDQQQAYDMTVAAFDLSERFRVPVLLRMVTRLAHSRTSVRVGEPRAENPAQRPPKRTSWILLPANARRQWHELLERQRELAAYSDDGPWNPLEMSEERRGLGVITAGLARNYYRENVGSLSYRPSHLHIGAYPLPLAKLRRLAAHCSSLLVLEDGYPFIERQLRGILETPLEIEGRLTGRVPAEGELNPDSVRQALGLAPLPRLEFEVSGLPNRPPQLCHGCPHGHAYNALAEALGGMPGAVVTSDIGCYTLGALPPYNAIESCVCMGASIGMARGAAEAGMHPVIAVIGDSTFLHSGITPLMDAIAADTDMTLLILDNSAVAMTGGQEPVMGTGQIHGIVRGLGIQPDQVLDMEPHPRRVAQNAEILRKAIAHHGLSVVIATKECKETARRKTRAAARPAEVVTS